MEVAAERTESSNNTDVIPKAVARSHKKSLEFEGNSSKANGEIKEVHFNKNEEIINENNLDPLMDETPLPVPPRRKRVTVYRTTNNTAMNIKPILKQKNNDRQVVHTSKKTVTFGIRPSFSNENNIPTEIMLSFVIHNSNKNNPIYHLKNLEQGDHQKLDSDIQKSQLEINDICYGFLYILFIIIYPLIVLSIPIKDNEDGLVTQHLSYSIGVVPMVSILLGIFSVLWMEILFECKFNYRIFLMTIWGPIGGLIHFLLSLAIGKILPLGLDIVLTILIITIGLVVIFILPKVEIQSGYLFQALSGTITLLSSILCIHLISLLELLKEYGIAVAICVVIITPLIYLRLTTDMQELIPNCPHDFSMIAASLLGWTFSFCSYIVLIQLAHAIHFFILYVIFALVDLMFVCVFGPIWVLWKIKGNLKPSGYSFTIFNWAQDPLKPKPILVKYITKLLASISFSITFGYCRISHNKSSFKFNSDIGDGDMILEIYAAMICEIVISMIWLIWMYRLMIQRSKHANFINAVSHISKLFHHVCIGGTLVSTIAFLLRVYPSYTSVLET